MPCLAQEKVVDTRNKGVSQTDKILIQHMPFLFSRVFVNCWWWWCQGEWNNEEEAGEETKNGVDVVD